ncbi:MAG: XdhC family protein, partial [Pseudolabrys sp.]
MNLAELQTVNAERTARRAVLVVTDIKGGAQRVVKAMDVANDPLKEVLQKRLRLGKSGMEETPEGEVFVTVHVPSAKLVITGAVHISQALAPMAKMLGYDVTVV